MKKFFCVECIFLNLIIANTKYCFELNKTASKTFTMLSFRIIFKSLNFITSNFLMNYSLELYALVSSNGGLME